MIEIYILIIIFVYITIQILLISNTKKNCDSNELETYKNIATPCKCKGGLYMSQGDSERAKLCKTYLNTEEHQQQDINYKCNTGDAGKKNKLFKYTPYIDDNWNHTCGSNINNNICKNI